MKRLISGFTLVEVMVTLAIIAILATIGYPLYVEQARNGKRADVQQALTILAKKQEDHLYLFEEYAANANELNLGPDGVIGGDTDTYAYNEVVSVIDRDSTPGPDYYDITFSDDGDPTTTDFLITATAARGQVDDENCVLFTINQLGTKYAEDSGGADNSEICWK